MTDPSIDTKQEGCGAPGGNCCSSAPSNCMEQRNLPHYIEGAVRTPVGEIPRVAARQVFADTVGTWKARWGLGRMRYRVEPGLYAVGNPAAESPVLVTANYKMSFDLLRRELKGFDAWILVLDTAGINVWCAAGKGTFGADELISRMKAVQLDKIVSHRTLVVPQLGAPGVSAHQVRKESGFMVKYGPVRAKDLPYFLHNGMKARPEMRRVRFTLADRIELIPMELVSGLIFAVVLAALFFLLSGLGVDGYSFVRALTVGMASALFVLGAFLAAVVFTPILLPWLPGSPFSLKGLWIGLVSVAGIGTYVFHDQALSGQWLGTLGWLLFIPAMASFIAMNFTGASTYTSLSGVRKEMKIAVPLQAAAAVAGVGLWLAGRFVT